MKNRAIPEPRITEALEAFGSTAKDMLKAVSGLSVPLPVLNDIQSDYVRQATDLWNRSMNLGSPTGAA